MEDLVIKENQFFFYWRRQFFSFRGYLRILYTTFANQNYFKTKFSKFKLVPNTRLTASARLSITQESRSFTNATVVQISILGEFHWHPRRGLQRVDFWDMAYHYAVDLSHNRNNFSGSLVMRAMPTSDFKTLIRTAPAPHHM